MDIMHVIVNERNKLKALKHDAELLCLILILQ